MNYVIKVQLHGSAYSLKAQLHGSGSSSNLNYITKACWKPLHVQYVCALYAYDMRHVCIIICVHVEPWPHRAVCYCTPWLLSVLLGPLELLDLLSLLVRSKLHLASFCQLLVSHRLFSSHSSSSLRRLSR